jgi:hypothetical protein
MLELKLADRSDENRVSLLMMEILDFDCRTKMLTMMMRTRKRRWTKTTTMRKRSRRRRMTMMMMNDQRSAYFERMCVFCVECDWHRTNFEGEPTCNAVVQRFQAANLSRPNDSLGARQVFEHCSPATQENDSK